MEEKKPFNWANPNMPLFGALFIIGAIIFLIVKSFFGMELLDWLNFFMGIIAGVAFILRYYKEKKKESIVEANKYLTNIGIVLVSVVILGLIIMAIFIFTSPTYTKTDCETKALLTEKYACYSQAAITSNNIGYCNKIDDNLLQQGCIETTLITAFESCCPSSSGNFDADTTKSNACCKQKFSNGEILYSCFAHCSLKNIQANVSKISDLAVPQENSLNTQIDNPDSSDSSGVQFIKIISPAKGDTIYLTETFNVRLKASEGSNQVELIFLNQEDNSEYIVPNIYTISSNTSHINSDPNNWQEINFELNFSDLNSPLPKTGKYIFYIYSKLSGSSWGGDPNEEFTIAN